MSRVKDTPKRIFAVGGRHPSSQYCNLDSTFAISTSPARFASNTKTSDIFIISVESSLDIVCDGIINRWRSLIPKLVKVFETCFVYSVIRMTRRMSNRQLENCAPTISTNS
ncbi:PREDICTED: uncharacterized protein LOC105458235 isoform X1 [Wasmannia auropunctata]|uniref:uncharacterized protein LOC105458235 isoform X1 n=1 Tax=Wasmannia auropunctata TaxID=64793 RepID=UPI0005EE16D9|nr:PREDICTED: uncharacterized protein LOC105458235 isoform X1 [Wasmannia auropunctata]XP_011701697.1 PREDICTED: uncharacterized protein LOC105458235 isoform X1 [Wasmannia auropunctata]